MLVERVSPAADQPESRAVGHPLVNLVNLEIGTPTNSGFATIGTLAR